MKRETAIFVVAHKEVPFPRVAPFVPIQVGNGAPIQGVECRDNTGDNIAQKNPNYCELTAQYWIWKNVKADYVGLVHYRRLPSFTNATDPLFWSFNEETCRRFGWEEKTIDKLLDKYDILLSPYWTIFPPGEPGNVMTPYQFHAYEHRESDIKETLQVIRDLTPEVYPSAEEALCKDTKQCFGNICIMKKDLFDAYSKWLFKVLFELERRIEIPKDKEQARVFGYLAERLIMVWVKYIKTQQDVRTWFAKAIPLGCFPEPHLSEKICAPKRERVEHPMLSVIIPVYNVEKYLIRCLNSVCTQSEENIEIICVNDGSTDCSLEILNSFAERDKRIRIISKENGGLGAARNTGIEAARGKYLAFVDSDDWVDRFIWFRSLRKMEQFNLDMLVFEVQDVDDETGVYLDNAWNCLRLPHECYRSSYTWREMGRTPFDSCCYAPCRVVRRSFWGERRFPVGVLYEDAVIHLDLLFSAKRIGAFACAFYCYRIRKNSLMSTKDTRVYDHFTVLDGVYEVLKKNRIEKALQESFIDYANQILTKVYAHAQDKSEAMKAICNFVADPKREAWGFRKHTSFSLSRVLLMWGETIKRRTGRNFSFIKYFLPYGLMSRWLLAHYGIAQESGEDIGKMKSMIRSALPYGCVRRWYHSKSRDNVL